MKLRQLCTIALLVANPSCVAIKQGIKRVVSTISREEVKPDTLKVIQPDTLIANLPKVTKDSFNKVSGQILPDATAGNIYKNADTLPGLSPDSILKLKKESEIIDFSEQAQRGIDSVKMALLNEKIAQSTENVEKQIRHGFVKKAESAKSDTGYCLRATKKAIEEYTGLPMKCESAYQAPEVLLNDMVDKNIYKKGKLIYEGTGAHFFEEVTNEPKYAEIMRLNKEYIDSFHVHFKNIKKPEKKSEKELKDIVERINNKPGVKEVREALRDSIQAIPEREREGLLLIHDRLLKAGKGQRWYFHGHIETLNEEGEVVYGRGKKVPSVFPTGMRIIRQLIRMEIPKDTTNIPKDTLSTVDTSRIAAKVLNTPTKIEVGAIKR